MSSFTQSVVAGFLASGTIILFACMLYLIQIAIKLHSINCTLRELIELLKRKALQ